MVRNQNLDSLKTVDELMLLLLLPVLQVDKFRLKVCKEKESTAMSVTVAALC